MSRLTFNIAQNLVRICRNRNVSICNRMNPSALLLLADGAEEQEAITIVNILRRGNINVTVGGVCGPDKVKCRSLTVICPDKSLQQAVEDGPYGAVILPGGLGGTKILCESALVGKVLKAQEDSNGLICAICAAPTALKKHNIGKGKNLTSYPAMAEEMKAGNTYNYHDDTPVVVDGKLITSRGPATAYIFALTILEHMVGKEKTKAVAEAMLYTY